MNFLAPFYFSGDFPLLSIGNYLGYFISARERSTLPTAAIKGVNLHYEIDKFTDNHPSFRKTVARLRPEFGKYAPVVADIYYDHFLASQWDEHHEEGLQNFANDRYQLIESNDDLLNRRAKQFHYYMKSRNILFNYQHPEQLHQVFLGISHRARFDSGMEKAVEHLRDHYHDYSRDFIAFFPDIKDHIGRQLEDHRE